jgi:hypothetical protein
MVNVRAFEEDAMSALFSFAKHWIKSENYLKAFLALSIKDLWMQNKII